MMFLNSVLSEIWCGATCNSVAANCKNWVGFSKADTKQIYKKSFISVGLPLVCFTTIKYGVRFQTINLILQALRLTLL